MAEQPEVTAFCGVKHFRPCVQESDLNKQCMWCKRDMRTAAHRPRTACAPLRTAPLPIDEAGEVPIDAWNRLKVTDPVVLGGPGPTVAWSNPSRPDTWAAAFTEPPPQGYEVLKGWTAVDPSIAPSRAKLTCDRNGLEPGSWEREQRLRAAQDEVLQAAMDKIDKLTERVAILEADNKAMIDRELSAVERMRHWRGRALKLACELAMLKQRTQSPHPVPAESSLDEPAAPSQDAIWRNATRFSR